MPREERLTASHVVPGGGARHIENKGDPGYGKDAFVLNDQTLTEHAMTSGAVLVTDRMREFEQVPGLTQEDWKNIGVKQGRHLSGLTPFHLRSAYSFSALVNGSIRIRALS